MEYVMDNNLEALKCIVNDNLIQAKDVKGNSIIKLAAMEGRTEILRYLMDRFGTYVDRQVSGRFIIA